MAISMNHRPTPRIHPAKLCRRTATSVMAGTFDLLPPRDVLTSVLNGVPPYKAVEKERDEDERRMRKKQKRERDRDRQRRKREQAKLEAAAAAAAAATATPATARPSTSTPPVAFVPPAITSAPSTSSFWRARPTIQIASMQRYMSVTPPPASPVLAAESSPATTPQPSVSSCTSRTSSKRPRTPDDDEDIQIIRVHSTTQSPQPQRPRKKRVAVRKGWKGWVEGSPPPSEKLIQLDAVPILQERRTRSGKNFDAIGVGKDGWV